LPYGPGLRRLVPFLSGIFVFSSLLVLRVTLPLVGFLTFPKAWGAGLYVGLLFDLALTCAAMALRRRWAYLAILAYWAAVAGNRLYYDYFHGVLEASVVLSHGRDIFYLGDSLAQMLTTEAMVASVALLLAGLGLRRKERIRGAGISGLVLAGMGLAFSFGYEGPAIFAWEPTQLLRARARSDSSRTKMLCDSSTPSVPAPKRRAYTVPDLGLDLKRPVNVIVLVVESLRGYEFFHPLWSETIFPRTSKWVKESGIAFPQAYTQVYEFGQTSRGQFSILCSRMPNFHEEAVFIEYPKFAGICLPQRLKAKGYQTAWFYGNEPAFHGQESFLKNHGVDHIFGDAFFKARGVSERINSWGFGDLGVLGASAEKIAEMAARGPVFATLMTSSTHPPFSTEMAKRLPPTFFSDHGIQDKIYQAFAGTFHYADEAIGNFLTKVFEHPALDNTVVVLVADHSSWPAPFAVSEITKFDMQFRIPIVLLTKRMPAPRRIDHVVTQSNIAPTLLAVLGLSPEPGWEGETLFDSPPMDWIVSWEGRPVYRSGAHYCLPDNAKAGRRKCYDLKGQDPLFSSAAFSEEAEDPARTEEFCHLLDRQAKEIKRLGGH